MLPSGFELLIVLGIGLLVIGVPIAILVFVVIMVTRQRRSGNDDQSVSRLVEENQALREEIATLKSKHN